MRDIDDKVADLVNEFPKLDDYEKRNKIKLLIESLVGGNLPPIKITIQDLNEIAAIASSHYRNLILTSTIDGEKLTPDIIRTILWVKGVSAVLGKKGLLPRKAIVEFDEYFITESAFID